MKKVYILIILIFGLLFVGCEKKEEVNNVPQTQESEFLEDDEVLLENIKYKLDQDDEGYNIKYKIAENFRKSTMTNAINYYSQKIDGNEYFVIRLLYYKNKTIDYAISDSTESYDNKYETKIGDNDYTVIHFKNFADADVNIYYHKGKKDVHAFVFTGRIDLSRLVQIFLSSVQY